MGKKKGRAKRKREDALRCEVKRLEKENQTLIAQKGVGKVYYIEVQEESNDEGQTPTIKIDSSVDIVENLLEVDKALEGQGHREVTLKAKGKAIAKAVMIAEYTKGKVKGLQQRTSIGGQKIKIEGINAEIGWNQPIVEIKLMRPGSQDEEMTEDGFMENKSTRQEHRVAQNGELYTKAEFTQHFGGDEEWKQASWHKEEEDHTINVDRQRQTMQDRRRLLMERTKKMTNDMMLLQRDLEMHEDMANALDKVLRS